MLDEKKDFKIATFRLINEYKGKGQSIEPCK
jgi:hypothetical protein